MITVRHLIQNSICFHVVQASLVECYYNRTVTRFSIQTAGLAIRRHRSVFLSCQRCWWQLCRAFNCRISYDHYLPTVILIIIGIPSPTHSFTLGLNPSFSAHPPYLFLIQVSLYGFPRLFTVTSEHIRLFTFQFFCFYTFLVVGSVPQIKLTYVGFRAHVNIASRIVSYRKTKIQEERKELRNKHIHTSRKTQTFAFTFSDDDDECADSAECWLADAKRRMLGGLEQDGVKTVAECKRACVDKDGCIGLDFDNHNRTCALHGRWATSWTWTINADQFTHYHYLCSQLFSGCGAGLVFYRAMLCIRGTSHGPVSVCPSVCLSVRHKSVFY